MASRIDGNAQSIDSSYRNSTTSVMEGIMMTDSEVRKLPFAGMRVKVPDRSLLKPSGISREFFK